MHNKLRPILAWAILFTFPVIIEQFFNYHHFFLKLLPPSLLSLDRDMWMALSITFAASIMAWFVAVGAGLLLGIGVSSTLLDESKKSHFLSFGSNVNMVMEAFYVIPFVLTVTLFY